MKQKTKQANKVFAIALLASVLAIPLAVHTYAQNDDQVEQEPIQTEQPQTEEQTPEPPPVEEVPPPQEVTEDDELPVEEEEEAPPSAGVSIADAIAIAQAEHPDVEVVMAKVKLKKLDDEKVYKIVFADGWRIYVRASDGEIVRIKDASDKKRACSDRGLRAVASWRSDHKKRWGHGHHQGFTHKKDWSRWHKPDQTGSEGGQSLQQNGQDQPAETEETTEESNN